MSQIDPDYTEPGWDLLSSESLFKNPWLDCQDVRTLTPSRRESPADWTVVRRKRGAAVAPILPDGRLLLIRQERVPLAQTLWEFPAGQIDLPLMQAPTEAEILETAHRELREETGYELPAGGELIPLGYYFSSQGFTDERIHLFAAVGVVPHVHGAETDENEVIHEARAFTPAELLSMLERSEIRDGNTLSICAKLLAKGLLKV
jgi:8-oxo-dGTP pyrophosphatase MutT (NUDIX family)